MNKLLTINQLKEAGALGIIRVDQAEDLVHIAQALQEGGLDCIEITMTTPGALRAIEEASGKLTGVLMGAGTVLDAATARQAILAGAEFLVTPTVELDVIETARRYGKVVIAGAMTLPSQHSRSWISQGGAWTTAADSTRADRWSHSQNRWGVHPCRGGGCMRRQLAGGQEGGG
jgi:2-dehydro-3-deoxyphosphogluconate aldolase/(4S)-4-hydroxy-2-oxoglutarate aldolase